MARHLGGDEVGQALHLPHPAAVHQAQVHHHRVHAQAVPLGGHMQQTALLEAVVADVVVADVADGPARQQRVAMLAVACHRIGAVGHVVAFGRQEAGLALRRPAEVRALELLRLPRVEEPHFLQEHEVGIQRFDGQAQVVDLQPLVRSEASHALVDVVGGHAQGGHVGLRRQQGGLPGLESAHGLVSAGDKPGRNRGSCRMASALLGEKQRSAASRHGSQTC